MQVYVPAMRGKMGTRTYYACLMPLEAIQGMFKFDPEERQWSDLSPEQREQRALNRARVPALTDYMLENEDDYLFASITASLDVLFDKRDPISISTLFALDKVPVFRELTEKVDAGLKAKSTKIFTLAALYDANSDLLKDRGADDVEDNAKLLTDYWSAVAENMVDWRKVLSGQKSAQELRAEHISSHSTVLRALGGLGADLMAADANWRDRLTALANIDWSKQNKEWQNVCIVANSVVSNRQARAATKTFIKSKLGMSLSEAEQRSLEKAAA